MKTINFKYSNKVPSVFTFLEYCLINNPSLNDVAYEKLRERLANHWTH